MKYFQLLKYPIFNHTILKKISYQFLLTHSALPRQKFIIIFRKEIDDNFFQVCQFETYIIHPTIV